MTKKKRLTRERSSFNPSVQALLAVGLFVIAVLLSRGAAMPAWEEAVFHAIYGLPRALYPFFITVTQLGGIFMLIALVLIYVSVKRYHIVLRLLMTGSLAYLIAGVAKDLLGRARPHEILTDVVSLDYFRGPGFPSGHTALAVALAFTMGHYMPKRYHWLVVVWIVSVGMSRIYLGVHAPLDVVGGFAIGWLCYALYRHVRLYDITFIGKSKNPNK